MDQTEANRLLGIRKWFPATEAVELRIGKASYELLSDEPAESFVLDAWRGSIRLTRATFNHRVRVNVILARLDLDGPPHTNPDGEVIPTPHLHVYREGFDDKWAFPLDDRGFSDPTDLATAFADFCRFCGIEPSDDLQLELL